MALIETIAAIAFVYALLSVIASAFKEMLEAYVQKRKTDLKAAITDLLGTTGAEALFKTSVLSVVTSTITASAYPDQAKDWPSYLDPENFVKALTALSESDKQRFKALWTASPLGQSIGEFNAGVTAQIDQIKLLYTQRMERVQGSFKRNAQRWLCGIGFVLAVALDADTLHLARQLGTDSTARALVIAMAEKNSNADFMKANCSAGTTGTPSAGGTPTSPPPGSAAAVAGAAAAATAGPTVDAKSDAQALIACLDSSLPGVLGWSDIRKKQIWTTYPDLRIALLALLGYLLTAFAVSLGAPFWFDLMNKVSNLRATLKPIAK